MKVRAIDENGDWEFGAGLNSYKLNNEAIKQNIKTRLLEWKEDAFWNLDAGINWYSRLGSKGQIDLLTADIKSIIVKTLGVVKLQEISVDFNSYTRQLSVSYTIQTIFSFAVQEFITLNNV